MKWTELNIDEDNAAWTIPAARMKMKCDLIIPLAKQVLMMLRELRNYAGRGNLVFPSPYSSTRKLSGQTLRSALLRIGYSKEQVSVAGFKTTALELLSKRGFKRELVEMQLGYNKKNSTITSRSEDTLPERRRMMQDWADYLDSLRAGSPIWQFDNSFPATDRLEDFTMLR